MSSILRSVDQLQEQRKRQTQQNKAYTENSLKLLTQVILNVNYVTFISNTKVQHKENLKIFPERTYLLIFTSTNLQDLECKIVHTPLVEKNVRQDRITICSLYPMNIFTTSQNKNHHLPFNLVSIFLLLRLLLLFLLKF